MVLKEKLEKLKKLNDQNKEPDWEAYKEVWKSAVSELQNTITNKWFHDYEENGLMTFELSLSKESNLMSVNIWLLF